MPLPLKPNAQTPQDNALHKTLPSLPHLSTKPWVWSTLLCAGGDVHQQLLAGGTAGVLDCIIPAGQQLGVELPHSCMVYLQPQGLLLLLPGRVRLLLRQRAAAVVGCLARSALAAAARAPAADARFGCHGWGAGPAARGCVVVGASVSVLDCGLLLLLLLAGGACLLLLLFRPEGSMECIRAAKEAPHLRFNYRKCFSAQASVG